MWKPALAEIEEALVPAFIIEELEDGRFTVFVPSVPALFAGASMYSAAIACIPWTSPSRRRSGLSLRWGSGSKDLVAAMKTESTLISEQRILVRPKLA